MDHNEKDIDYTIVLDGSYTGPLPGSAESATAEPEAENTGHKAAIDRLYEEYEQMCFKLPTVLDEDDIYPHTYQWRIGDRYDPVKVAVVEEALKRGKKIAETEAYESYVEGVKKSGFRPVSWD